MEVKLHLLITDEEIILYKDTTEKSFSFKEGVKYIQEELLTILHSTPKRPVCLLVDRSHQDIREEELPSLFLWDKFRLLSHKKDIWASQEGFYGYIFLKQEGKTYLQWINISQSDPLYIWLSWITTLSNPLGKVSFVSLESKKFLTKYLEPSETTAQSYQMLIYKILHKKRHIIFKGKRLLLSRQFQEEEDIKSSLHFMSRTYPDIHEKLHIVNLLEDMSASFPKVQTIRDPKILLNFLTSQKQGSLILNLNKTPKYILSQKFIRSLFFISFLGLGGIILYTYLCYQKVNFNYITANKQLETKIYNLKLLLKDKNVLYLYSALQQHDHLKSQIKDPFKIIHLLSIVLRRHGIRLEKFFWNLQEKLEIELDFFMPLHSTRQLLDDFNALISTLNKNFPECHIYVLEGPFHSNAQETYIYPPKTSLPMVKIKVHFP